MTHKDPERRRQYQKEYQEKNRELLRQKRKQHWLQHRDRLKQKHSEWYRNHYAKNREEMRLRFRERYKNDPLFRQGFARRGKKNALQFRAKVMEHYGNVCQCCGERDQRFFQVDHINNDGNVFRKTHGQVGGKNFYVWIIKNNFPSDLQILCSNCNFGKKNYGGICPHMIPLTSV